MHALTGPAQFDAVLSSRKRINDPALSAHFVLHYLMKTEPAQDTQAAIRVGFIVAKRLSKRAARRNLIRRVWKEAIRSKADALATDRPYCDLVIRQHKALDKERFHSANSRQVRLFVRQEAEALIARWLKALAPTS